MNLNLPMQSLEQIVHMPSFFKCLEQNHQDAQKLSKILERIFFRDEMERCEFYLEEVVKYLKKIPQNPDLKEIKKIRFGEEGLVLIREEDVIKIVPSWFGFFTLDTPQPLEGSWYYHTDGKQPYEMRRYQNSGVLLNLDGRTSLDRYLKTWEQHQRIPGVLPHKIMGVTSNQCLIFERESCESVSQENYPRALRQWLKQNNSSLLRSELEIDEFSSGKYAELGHNQPLVGNDQGELFVLADARYGNLGKRKGDYVWRDVFHWKVNMRDLKTVPFLLKAFLRLDRLKKRQNTSFQWEPELNSVLEKYRETFFMRSAKKDCAFSKKTRTYTTHERRHMDR
ncbi:MAG: hypothetical protein ACOY3I_01775 [Verrucomicrobiota bacterium]